MQIWRLLRTGHSDAAWNMAVDEALLGSVARGKAPTTLRLYGWRPPAVSLGYFQDLDGVAVEEVRRRGFGLVRRPTGGRAILHDDELTYSVAIRQELLADGQRVMGSYKELSRGLEAGLARLGVSGGPTAPAAPTIPRADRSGLVVNCFARAAAGDLVAAGRKIIGSAQTRREGAILQHGSLPLRIHLADQLAVMPPAALSEAGSSRPEAGPSIAEAACGIADLIGRDVTFDEAAEAIAQGFAEAFGIKLAEGELSDEEVAAATALLETKYATEAWTATVPRREPASTLAADSH